MQACLKAFDRVRRVPKIRRRHDRRIETFFRREHLVDVGIALRRVTLQGTHLGDATLEVVVPNVADRLKMQPRDVRHRIEQDLALLAESNERDMQLVRFLTLRRTQDVWHAKHQAGTDAARCLADEITAADHAGFHFHALTIS